MAPTKWPRCDYANPEQGRCTSPQHHAGPHAPEFNPTVQHRCESWFGGERCVREHNHPGMHEDTKAPVTHWDDRASAGRLRPPDYKALLQEVMAAPLSNKGHRFASFPPSPLPTRYTAKMLPDELVARIREALA